MRPLTYLLLLAALPACTPTTDPTGTAAESSTSSSSGADTTSSSTVTPTTTDGTTTDASTSTTSSTTTTDPGESTTGPITTTAPDPSTTTGDTTLPDDSEGTADTGPVEGALVIAIVDAELYADCQPRIEPDPVMGGWTVQFDNSQGVSDTSAVVVAASLSLDVDPPVLEPIEVSPVDSGQVPAGEQVDLGMDKLTGAKHSACDHCGEFYKLVLEYDENGTMHHVEEDVTISCAF